MNKKSVVIGFGLGTFFVIGGIIWWLIGVVYAQSGSILKEPLAVPFYIDETFTKGVVNWFLGGGLVSILVSFVRSQYQAFKRYFDFLVAGLSLLVLSPLFFIIAILIKISSKGPIFFSQDRVGRNGATFKIMKFRTMHNNAELATGPVWAQDNDPRITKIGRFLRKTHLDELPQFINVFKGEMSLIGPRPERPEFIGTISKHIPNFYQRLNIKPGITGLAQVHYRYGASIRDAAIKLKYDMIYIKRMCWLLDFRIILWTVERVLRDEGAR